MADANTVLADQEVAHSSKQSHYNEKFDPDAYLRAGFNPESENPVSKLRKDVPLQQIDEFFRSYARRAKGLLASVKLKVLEYGCGPCLIHAISAAAQATEIVFADYTERNCHAIQRWLERDPKAFNWSPYFDYVVQNLEGRTEKESREREEQLRNVVKGVVHCDITQDNPIERGYEGPYDVIITIFCLASACKTPEEFVAAVDKLMGLLKPGGKIVIYDSERVLGAPMGLWTVGDQVFHSLALSRSFVKATLEKTGFCDVAITSFKGTIINSDVATSDAIGTMFASATKPV